jgi:hypothetical protein
MAIRTSTKSTWSKRLSKREPKPGCYGYPKIIEHCLNCRHYRYCLEGINTHMGH